MPTALPCRIFVDYAHTDDALRNVLATLRALNPETLRVVFGCGGERDRSKRARMAKVAAELADVLIITTDNPRREDPARIIDDMRAGLPPDKDATVIADRATAIHQAVADSGGGDALLIAGKGHEKYQEIEGVKHPFSDGDQVRVAMRAAGILPRNIDAGRNPDHDYRVA